MKINWEITLLSLIALFTGIVVYTIWSVYNFAPVKMAITEAMRELAAAQEKQMEEEREFAAREVRTKEYEFRQRELPGSKSGGEEITLHRGGGSGFSTTY